MLQTFLAQQAQVAPIAAIGADAVVGSTTAGVVVFAAAALALAVAVCAAQNWEPGPAERRDTVPANRAAARRRRDVFMVS